MKNILLYIFLSCGMAVSAQDKTLLFDRLFSIPQNSKTFNGNVLVAEKGKIIYQKSYGLRDFSKNLPLNHETVFELASVSKQFTAMGIMLLKKNGRLSYDDSLRKFFPQLPYSGVTVRHLLQHTGGLPDYMELFDSLWNSDKIAGNDDMIRLYAEHKPAILFQPGKKWEYSNTGYVLLASIIEKVSGKSFGEYMHENIFKPLGMKQTLVFRRRLEKRSLPNYAYGYVRDKATGAPVLPDSTAAFGKMVYTLDGFQGDGIVNSTTSDLFKWDRALYSDKLVSKAMLDEAFTPAQLPDTTYGYGFGWGISTIPGIGRRLSHSGGWPGYTTFIERYPEHQSTIIILQNADGPRPSMKSIRDILFNIKDSVKAINVDASLFKDYIGEYELAPNFSITISADSALYAQATGQSRLQLFAEKADLFFLKVVEAKIRFVRNAEGKVDKLILMQNGQEVPGTKKSK